MAYWHQREDGSWYFDWSHLWVVGVLLVYLLYALLRGDK